MNEKNFPVSYRPATLQPSFCFVILQWAARADSKFSDTSPRFLFARLQKHKKTPVGAKLLLLWISKEFEKRLLAIERARKIMEKLSGAYMWCMLSIRCRRSCCLHLVTKKISSLINAWAIMSKNERQSCRFVTTTRRPNWKTCKERSIATQGERIL